MASVYSRASADLKFGTLYVRRTTDHAGKTADTTAADDDQLTLAVAANTTYKVRALVFFDGATAGDIKLALSGPSGATLSYGILGPGSSSSALSSISVRMSVGGGGSIGAVGVGTSAWAVIEGIIRVASTAGNVAVQWAQGTSDATATRLLTDSHLTLDKLA